MTTITLPSFRAGGKIDRMPKKKSGGDHKTPRVAVQIPEPWWSLARQLASKSKQPTLWYLLGLIAADAENNELPHPKLPWEEEA